MDIDNIMDVPENIHTLVKAFMKYQDWNIVEQRLGITGLTDKIREDTELSTLIYDRILDECRTLAIESLPVAIISIRSVLMSIEGDPKTALNAVTRLMEVLNRLDSQKKDSKDDSDDISKLYKRLSGKAK